MKVTLYNRHGDGWRRTVLEAEYALWKQGFSYSAGRMDGGREESLLLIPLQGGYLTPQEYQNREEPEGYFTFQAGDGILAGEGQEAEKGHLKTQFPQIRIISGVKEQIAGSGMDHWEVTAA